MFALKIFVVKGGAIDAEGGGAVTLVDVASLDHKVTDDPVKGNVLPKDNNHE